MIVALLSKGVLVIDFIGNEGFISFRSENSFVSYCLLISSPQHP